MRQRQISCTMLTWTPSRPRWTNAMQEDAQRGGALGDSARARRPGRGRQGNGIMTLRRSMSMHLTQRGRALTEHA